MGMQVTGQPPVLYLSLIPKGQHHIVCRAVWRRSVRRHLFCLFKPLRVEVVPRTEYVRHNEPKILS